MKDPAFLFYHRDFLVGTENMSLAATGAYIKLMCIQADQGHVTEKHMKKICSNICFETMQISLDENTYNEVKTKFTETAPGSGLYINNRLAEEIQKRIKYSESRRKNRKPKTEKTYDVTYDNTYVETYEKHMVNANANANINTDINENIKGGMGGKSKNEKTENIQIKKWTDQPTGEYAQPVHLSPPTELTAACKEKIKDFNQITGKNYPVSINARHLVELMAHGYTLAQVDQVIANRVEKWKGSARMSEYLRPQTLFNPANFANYLNDTGATDTKPRIVYMDAKEEAALLKEKINAGR